MAIIQTVPALGPRPIPLQTIHSGWHRTAGRGLVRAMAILSLSAAISIAAQLLYPRDRTVPTATFAGMSLGWLTPEQLREKLVPLSSQTFTSQANKASYDVSLDSLGLSLDSQQIAKQLADYPLSRRIVPFSAFFYRAPVQDQQVRVADRGKLEAFVQKVAQENNTPPVEGTIINSSGKFSVQASTPGIAYNTEEIVTHFSGRIDEPLQGEIRLPYTAQLPINDNKYLAGLLAQAQTVAQTDITLVADDFVAVVPGSAIAPAIRFKTDSTTKLVKIDYDQVALGAALEEPTDKAFISPTRENKGRELNRPATAAALAAALVQEQKTVQALLLTLQPNNGTKLYPATSKGISQLIHDWNNSHRSLELAVEFSEVGGFRRQASLRASERYFSASVYKSLVAWNVLKGVDEGRVNPDDILAKGLSLDGCLEQMIVISESVCSETAVYKFGGWKALDEFIAANGVQGINLSSGVSITASGMTQFLQKLNAGELMSEDGTKKLLGLMKRQKYRQGIPAGSAGEVADKVGYMPWSYSWHDAAIVYHPKGTYTLVILTKSGASLPTIADLARNISGTIDR